MQQTRRKSSLDSHDDFLLGCEKVIISHSQKQKFFPDDQTEWSSVTLGVACFEFDFFDTVLEETRSSLIQPFKLYILECLESHIVCCFSLHLINIVHQLHSSELFLIAATLLQDYLRSKTMMFMDICWLWQYIHDFSVPSSPNPLMHRRSLSCPNCLYFHGNI